MSDLRPVTSRFRREHAEKLRGVARRMAVNWTHSHEIEVSMYLFDLADKIDLAFELPANVVRIRPHSDGPSTAA